MVEFLMLLLYNLAVMPEKRQVFTDQNALESDKRAFIPTAIYANDGLEHTGVGVNSLLRPGRQAARLANRHADVPTFGARTKYGLLRSAIELSQGGPIVVSMDPSSTSVGRVRDLAVYGFHEDQSRGRFRDTLDGTTVLAIGADTDTLLDKANSDWSRAYIEAEVGTVLDGLTVVRHAGVDVIPVPDVHEAGNALAQM